MNWEQFKAKVDASLKELGVDADKIEVDWIDTLRPTDEFLEVLVTEDGLSIVITSY